MLRTQQLFAPTIGEGGASFHSISVADQTPAQLDGRRGPVATYVRYPALWLHRELTSSFALARQVRLRSGQRKHTAGVNVIGGYSHHHGARNSDRLGSAPIGVSSFRPFRVRRQKVECNLKMLSAAACRGQIRSDRQHRPNALSLATGRCVPRAFPDRKGKRPGLPRPCYDCRLAASIALARPRNRGHQGSGCQLPL